jgi:hypothetical protein
MNATAVAKEKARRRIDEALTESPTVLPSIRRKPFNVAFSIS